ERRRGSRIRGRGVGLRGGGARACAAPARRSRAAGGRARAGRLATGSPGGATASAKGRRVVTNGNGSLATLEGVRITTVLNWSALGGAERRALALAQWLRDEQNASVEFLALTDRDGRAAEAARALGIPWRTVVVDWDGGKRGKAADYARFVAALRKGR